MEATIVRRQSVEESARVGALALEHRSDGRLWVVRDGREHAVSVRRLFPWSEPGRHLSLRDDEEREVALVRDPAELDAASRGALERALVEAGFVFDVVRVLDIEEEIELRYWRVETRQGLRAFQTRLDDWPRGLPHGGFLVRDVTGDLYRLPEPDGLDRTSRALLWAFVD